MRRNGATPPAIWVENVVVELGDVRVLEEVTFSVNPGALVGVVGPNGGGKTTLFNVIVGLVPTNRRQCAHLPASSQAGAWGRCIRSSERESQLAVSPHRLGCGHAGAGSKDRLATSTWTPRSRDGEAVP